MKRTLFICLSVIMLALVGCNKDKNTWGKLEEGSVKVMVGDSVQLTFDNNGNKYPQWSSDDEFIATVSDKGMVVGRHVGKTTVYVNNLACDVIVTDEYESEYNLDEPFKDWNINDAAVQIYEAGKRGVSVHNYVMDSVKMVIYDTLYIPNEDSTEWDMQVTERDSILYTYVKEATYDYTASPEDLLVDYAEYTYGYTYDSKNDEYSTHIVGYDYRVAEGYENEIYAIYGNRYEVYEETADCTTYVFKDNRGKNVYIFIQEVADGRMHIIFAQNQK